ncbi:MAG: YjbH domain-containing protein [Alphaproteobacteria bacterium]|nr:YjbH domain-containing protein [Alphaproteobacteria bacterium]
MFGFRLRVVIIGIASLPLFVTAGRLPVYAQSFDASPSIAGPLGLNTVPSARMDEDGMLRASVSTLDPYVHSTLGVQLAPPLYIALRQSAETSDINDNARRLYPGVDLKLRLIEEGRARPAIALGLQSAVGHKRMAGEYLALSKRYKAFDFTGGIGWGRYGSAAHLDNPLKSLHSHFGQDRPLDGENPSGPALWFTGEKIGLFGGVEYFTPFEGLSFKLDIGADRYEAEKAAFAYNVPAPWAVGLNYSPARWMDISVGAQGTDKIMGRLSLQGLAGHWRDKAAGYGDGFERAKLNPARTGTAQPSRAALSADKEFIILSDVQTDGLDMHASMKLRPVLSTPYQLGRAAIHMANHAGPSAESLKITPTLMGLYGPSVLLMRRDFERALTRKQGSAEEIWHNAEFDASSRKLFHKQNRFFEFWNEIFDSQWTLDQQISLSEEDHGVLSRTALLAEAKGPSLFGLLDTGYGLRWNAAHNLKGINAVRGRAEHPVRSDIDLFAARGLAVENLYSAFTHSFTPELHMSLIGGYLEEMYGGLGGEVLYRPFRKRFALGAESWITLKRNPLVPLNMGFTGEGALSGHVNAWYDLPSVDLTLKGSVGRYLAEDVGASLALQKRFRNGALLEGLVTFTDKSDIDPFGGVTQSWNGLRLTLPLGGYAYAPENAQIRLRAEPFGRDSGQRLDNPLSLYELTEPFSYSHMVRYWDDILMQD